MKKINKQISKISSRNNAIKLNETQMEKIIGGRPFWGSQTQYTSSGRWYRTRNCYFWICGSWSGAQSSG